MGGWTAGIFYGMLVDDRPQLKLRAGLGRGSHKAELWGRRDTATDPAPSPGAAARTLGDRKEITGQANACRHGVALADCTRHRVGVLGEPSVRGTCSQFWGF